MGFGTVIKAGEVKVSGTRLDVRSGLSAMRDMLSGDMLTC